MGCDYNIEMNRRTLETDRAAGIRITKNEEN